MERTATGSTAEIRLANSSVSTVVRAGESSGKLIKSSVWTNKRRPPVRRKLIMVPTTAKRRMERMLLKKCVLCKQYAASRIIGGRR